MKIEDRIHALMLERSSLEAEHAQMIKLNQQMNQEFQQAVVKNQTRFAQITGGIAELQKLKGENNHDNRISSAGLSDRLTDVRPCEQSEGR